MKQIDTTKPRLPLDRLKYPVKHPALRTDGSNKSVSEDKGSPVRKEVDSWLEWRKK